MLSWGTLPVDQEEARAFLQRRLSFLGLMVFVLSALFFPAMIAMDGLGERELGQWTAAAFDPLHGAGTAMSLAVWLAFRRGTQSAAVLRVADAAYAIGVCACWTGMGFGARDYVHVEFFVLLPTSLTLVFRCAIVPSTGKRTLAISTSAMGLVAIASFIFHLRPDVPAALGDRVAYTMMTASWCAVATVVASVSSHVTYGLRRRAGEAKQLGQYRLIRRIGAGGMGIVYEAEHAMLRRPTAVKLIAESPVCDRVQLSRFEREVQLTSILTHPNTIDIYDYGRTPDGVFYYAMEYLDGPTVRELGDDMGPMNPRRAIHLLRQLCGALAEAHAAGIIHRDVKPDNIIVTNSRGAHDLPTLLDFGLVKDVHARPESSLSQANLLVGTPGYVSPEMIRGETVDARSDLYALGAVAYYMITGTTVFDGKTVLSVCGDHLWATPVRPSERLPYGSVPPDLEQLILDCLAKDPDDRPQDALALRAALDACAGADPWSWEEAEPWWNLRRANMCSREVSGDGSRATPRTHVTVDVAHRCGHPAPRDTVTM